jgi:hypothetical protein
MISSTLVVSLALPTSSDWFLALQLKSKVLDTAVPFFPSEFVPRAMRIVDAARAKRFALPTQDGPVLRRSPVHELPLVQ